MLNKPRDSDVAILRRRRDRYHGKRSTLWKFLSFSKCDIISRAGGLCLIPITVAPWVYLATLLSVSSRDDRVKSLSAIRRASLNAVSADAILCPWAGQKGFIYWPAWIVLGSAGGASSGQQLFVFHAH